MVRRSWMHRPDLGEMHWRSLLWDMMSLRLIMMSSDLSRSKDQQVTFASRLDDRTLAAVLVQYAPILRAAGCLSQTLHSQRSFASTMPYKGSFQI